MISGFSLPHPASEMLSGSPVSHCSLSKPVMKLRVSRFPPDEVEMHCRSSAVHLQVW